MGQVKTKPNRIFTPEERHHIVEMWRHGYAQDIIRNRYGCESHKIKEILNEELPNVDLKMNVFLRENVKHEQKHN